MSKKVIAIFMAMFGINFGMYYLLLLRQFKVVFKNEELRTYLRIIFTSVILITINHSFVFTNFIIYIYLLFLFYSASMIVLRLWQAT